jgi:hypothetical protein
MLKFGNQLLKKNIKEAKKLYQKGQKIRTELKQVVNNNFTQQEIGTIKEFTGGVALAGVAYQGNKYRTENPEFFTSETLHTNLGSIAKSTIPANYPEKDPREVRIDINRELDNLVFGQDLVNRGRGMAATCSPVFTAMPIFTKFALGVTTGLSVGDAVTIGHILRLKEKVNAHPNIFTCEQKEEYDALMTKIEKHILKTIGFDILKVSYRGQLVAVNKELRKKSNNINKKTGSTKKDNKNTDETDDKSHYQMGFLNELAGKRMIPEKSNLPIVGWIFPTSLLISQLSAHDTQELTDDINKLNDFFKNIVFKGEEGEGACEDLPHHHTQQKAIVVKQEIPQHIEDNKPVVNQEAKKLDAPKEEARALPQ